MSHWVSAVLEEKFAVIMSRSRIKSTKWSFLPFRARSTAILLLPQDITE